MSRFSAALFLRESLRDTCCCEEEAAAADWLDLGLVLPSLLFLDRDSDLLVPLMAFVILCSVDSFSLPPFSWKDKPSQMSD